MSFQAMAWAHAQKVPDAECKLLLLILADYANDHDQGQFTCWPSVARLCSDCILSENTVRKRLKQLVDLKLLAISPRHSDKGTSTTNLYTLPVVLRTTPPADGTVTPPRDGTVRVPPDAPEPVMPKPVIEPLDFSYKRRTIPLSEEEAVVMGNMRACPEEWAKAFYNHYQAVGWIDANGHPIMDGGAKLNVWIAEQRQRQQQARSGGSFAPVKRTVYTGPAKNGF